MPKYKLTIEETVTGKRLTECRWVQTGQDPAGEKAFGWSPQIEEIGENTETVFDMTFAGEPGCLMRIVRAILDSIDGRVKEPMNFVGERLNPAQHAILTTQEKEQP